MDKDMYRWALSDIDRVYPDKNNPTRQTLLALLSIWSRMDTFAGDKLDREKVLDMFMHLAQGKSIPAEDAEPPAIPPYWVPASQRPFPGVVVRVVPDHIDGEDGWKLNGRVGKITAVRRGDIIIEFDKPLAGAPVEARGRPSMFEVDISDLRGADA